MKRPKLSATPSCAFWIEVYCSEQSCCAPENLVNACRATERAPNCPHSSHQHKWRFLLGAGSYRHIIALHQIASLPSMTVKIGRSAPEFLLASLSVRMQVNMLRLSHYTLRCNNLWFAISVQHSLSFSTRPRRLLQQNNLSELHMRAGYSSEQSVSLHAVPAGRFMQPCHASPCS